MYRQRHGKSCIFPSSTRTHSHTLNLLSKACCLACRSGTYFCVDKSVTAVVIKGLAEHKDTLGVPLCPCRHYDDKEAEAAQGFWNCPCVPMRERKVCQSRCSLCLYSSRNNGQLQFQAAVCSCEQLLLSMQEPRRVMVLLLAPGFLFGACLVHG